MQVDKSLISNFPDNNILINGNMLIDQANVGGATSTGAASTAYMIDNFKVFHEATSIVLSGQQLSRTSSSSNVPSNGLTEHALNFTATTGASVSANDYCEIRTYIEGHNYAPIHGQQLTLSFWVKATVTGTYHIHMTNHDISRSYVHPYTINSSNTWEYKTLSFTADTNSTTTGSTTQQWNINNGIGLQIHWIMAHGSSQAVATTTNSWVNHEGRSTSSQTNAFASTSNIFSITQAKLEAGTSATPFVPRSINDELRLCQRYYQKSYELGTAPGTASAYKGAYLEYTDASNELSHSGTNIISMRTSPTGTVYSPETGASGKFRNASTASDVNGSLVASTLSQNTWGISNGAGGSGNDACYWHVVLDARF